MSGLVEAARFASPLAAELARAFLESYGLHPVVFDSHSFGNSEGAMITVRLMVVDNELGEAAEILRSYRA